MAHSSHLDIWKFYAYSFLSSCLFFLPIDVLFFQERGLSVTEIFWIGAIYSFSVVLLEVPTGAIADYVGRKKSLILGVGAWVIAYVLFYYGWGFYPLVCAYIVWAVGAALTSGADTALLYDILYKSKKHETFSHYQGVARMLRLLGLSSSALIGGYMASFGLVWPFVWTIVPCLGCLYILGSVTHEEKQKSHTTSYLEIVRDSVQIIKNNAWIQWCFCYAALFALSFHISRPYMQIYLEENGVDIKYFGLATAITFLMSALSSKYAHSFEKQWGRSLFVALPLGLLLVVVPLTVIQSAWGIISFGGIAFLGAIMSIIIDHEILKSSAKDRHATILSFQNLLERLSVAAIFPLFGLYLQKQGSVSTLEMSSLVLGGGFVMLLWWYKLLAKEGPKPM